MASARLPLQFDGMQSYSSTPHLGHSTEYIVASVRVPPEAAVTATALPQSHGKIEQVTEANELCSLSCATLAQVGHARFRRTCVGHRSLMA